MAMLQKAMLGLVAVLALSAPAMAQNAFEGPKYMLVTPDGKMMTGPMRKKDWDEAIKHAQPLQHPVMLMVNAGKMYLVPDMTVKMSNGQSMIDYMSKAYGNFGG